MISVKISTNPEIFNGFGGGHWIDMARSHEYTRNNSNFDVRSSQKLSRGEN
jgi:hypothetical protein